VSADRVIGTTVGLRPHRESGFVVRAQSLPDGLLVHHYGHGGAGMSLSWGTARLAADLALEQEGRTAAVIGCGVVGLTTAIQLQRRGFTVTIYAATVPPDTTSNLSWASFTPTSGLFSTETTAEWDQQFRTAVEWAYRELQLLVGRGYGVSWVDSYSFLAAAPRPLEPSQPVGEDALLPAAVRMTPELLGPGEHPFPAPYVRRRPALRMEPSLYLDALVREARTAGARIVIRRFAEADDLAGLSQAVVVNCTGLGAQALLGDSEMVPVRGQLTLLVPQPEVDYSTLGGVPRAGAGGGFGIHMLPRADGIALGGTSERGEWSLEPDLEAQTQILAGHAALFGGMRG